MRGKARPGDSKFETMWQEGMELRNRLGIKAFWELDKQGRRPGARGDAQKPRRRHGTHSRKCPHSRLYGRCTRPCSCCSTISAGAALRARLARTRTGRERYTSASDG